MDYSAYRQEVYETTMKLVEKDLIRLSSGNVSVKTADGNVAITPSGILYDDLKPEDIVIIDMDCNIVEGKYKPSSEKALHTLIYKAREDIGGVVHAHSVYGIACGSAIKELPVICIELLAVGGPTPVVPYSCPGTLEIAENTAAQFAQNARLKAVLLENHGLIGVGPNLNQAYQSAYKLETGAQIYHVASQSEKAPRALTMEEIEEVFQIYQKPKKSA
jgi:ribulose-5-phosphate 4-epimerase/fuculose-1-phosphate aldolase